MAYHLTVAIDADLRARVEAYAASLADADPYKRVNQSDAVRRLLRAGLSALSSADKPLSETPDRNVVEIGRGRERLP